MKLQSERMQILKLSLSTATSVKTKMATITANVYQDFTSEMTTDKLHGCAVLKHINTEFHHKHTQTHTDHLTD